MMKRLAVFIVGWLAVVAIATPANAMGIQEHRSEMKQRAKEEGRLGDEALNSKNYDEAIDHYTKYLDAHICEGSECGTYYFHRGVAYQQKQDCAKAIADYEEAQKTLTDNGELYFNASLCHTALNQNDAALADLNNALRVNPDSNIYHVGRCIALFNKQDFAGALPDCEFTLGSAPDDQNMLYATAMSAEQTGDKGKAAKYYKHLHDLNPGDTRASDGLARVGG